MEIEKYEKGELVWAKIKGYPWWPSIVVECYTDNQDDPEQIELLVNFIGENSQQSINIQVLLQITIMLLNFRKIFNNFPKLNKKNVQSQSKLLRIYKLDKLHMNQKKTLSNNNNKKKTIQKSVKVQKINNKLNRIRQKKNKSNQIKKISNKKKKVTVIQLDVQQIEQIEKMLNINFDSLKQKIKQKPNDEIYQIIENIIQELNLFVGKNQFHKENMKKVFQSQIGVLFSKIQNVVQNYENKWDLYKQEFQKIQAKLNNQIVYQYTQQNKLNQNQDGIEFDNREESLFNQSEFSLQQKSESQHSTNNEICNQEIRKKACNKLAKIFTHKYGHEKKESQMKTLMIEAMIRRIDPYMGKQYRELMSLVLKLSNYKLFDIQKFVQEGLNIQEYKNILISYEQQQGNQN